MSPCFCPSSSLFCSSSQIQCLSPLPSGCGHILSSFSCRSPFLYPWPLTPSAAPSPSLSSDAILAPCPISTVPIVVLCPHPGSLTHLIPLSPFQSLVPHSQVSIQSPSKLLDWLCPLPLCLPPPCTCLCPCLLLQAWPHGNAISVAPRGHALFPSSQTALCSHTGSEHPLLPLGFSPPPSPRLILSLTPVSYSPWSSVTVLLRAGGGFTPHPAGCCHCDLLQLCSQGPRELLLNTCLC